MRRMMMNAGHLDVRFKYKGGAECLRRVIGKEGFTALYRGVGINVMAGLGGAVALVVFDIVQGLFTHQRYQRYGERAGG